ncbi:MAG: hypothetical protein COV74_06375 [Candidatus Omnitrophica bacterium CG11_big_fil_rev_8_21_14_0_20_45_26]|uniref:DUF5666 domain-containing protein n=1 Tax=Candidatus Abzuiibacterium crystallinum TaxID=1974748 RepID=A0A2H0LQU9_9BACT|nr:MAG: hypothetical protein COV74_06375 [Candidatus Omnitrophica bacterium CG11_big_fil_rev_8_21_14_0_20_45_26]PIW65669.1 MAG: hypothetical protein COW12_00755 [Candidatus Omnitrophica bacterium CG12_big_fil_rev_8_21_14_0_65_45_16]
MQIIRRLAFAFALMLLCTNTAGWAGEFLTSVTGKIVKVSPREHELQVGEINASTGVLRILKIKLQFSTRFIGVQNLSDLKVDDMVLVDFEQAPGGQFLAQTIEAYPAAKTASADASSSDIDRATGLTW